MATGFRFTDGPCPQMCLFGGSVDRLHLQENLRIHVRGYSRLQSAHLCHSSVEQSSIPCAAHLWNSLPSPVTALFHLSSPFAFVLNPIFSIFSYFLISFVQCPCTVILDTIIVITFTFLYFRQILLWARPSIIWSNCRQVGGLKTEK